nr:carbohydrate ABC transporter permease [Paenibacillus lactis]
MIIHLLFALLSLAVVLPFLLVIAVSFTDEASLTENGYQFLPKSFSLEAYRYLLDAPDILLRSYGVTVTVTVIGALAGLLLTAMTAYVISRPDYRYNRATTFYVFFTMLFSGGLVPSYILITQYLHLKDSLLALILPVLLSPFNIMVMKGFMSKIPLEIVESAKIDGARELRIFFGIILPLSTPALATLGLLISFTYWNEWFNAMLYIDDPNKVPLQLLLVRTLSSIEFITSNSEFTQQLGIDLSSFPNNSARMAIAVLAGGPMLVIFPFFQRFFVKGLTVGSLKG